ncbi:MAG: EamA family transporter, partial [Selenomonadaceae bacterium]|nr:EamA family transporter [Selenomonadaceae bacterium]
MRLRGNLFLMMAAFLWGTTFVAQMTGMDNLGPFTYAASRYFLGFCSLLLIWWLYRGPRRIAKQAGTYMPGWKAGMGAGCIMFVATSFQQVAMLYTTAG